MNRSKMGSTVLCLFLAELGPIIEVYFLGRIAIVELEMVVVGINLFFVNFHRLRLETFLPFVRLTILTCVGCFVAGKVDYVYRFLCSNS